MAVDGQRFMTKTQHYRKVTKPLLERKRRARMNLYLDELKDLIVDTVDAPIEQAAKLEKADILEMTVNYLKTRRVEHLDGTVSNIGGNGSGMVHMEKFRAGYTQAAYDVSKVFASLPGLDLKFGTHLMQHLGCRLKDLKPRASATITPAAAASKNATTPTSFRSPMQPAINIRQEAELKLEAEVKNEDVWRPW